MSTRSAIVLSNKDGVQIIYCHHDGYIEHNGRILNKHYNTRQAVQELVDLGDISVLGESIDTCIAYHRDEGEDYEYTAARLYSNHYQMLKEEFEGSDYEYLYIFLQTGKWAVISSKDAATKGTCLLNDEIAMLNRSEFRLV